MKHRSSLLLARLGVICALLAGTTMPSAGFAQSYPNRPILMLYPYSAGSGPDILIRTIAANMAPTLGQSVQVENRPGAAGRNGVNALKTSRNDGYLLVAMTSVEGMVQGLGNPGFALEAHKDFAPVTIFFETPTVLSAHPSMPFRDLRGLISYAKANPGKLNSGTSGIGSSTHLAVEVLNSTAGIDIVPVHYKGVGPAITANMGGEIQLAFAGGTAKPPIDAGRLVGIVTTGERRWRIFPTVPTMIESGVSFKSAPWIGLVAPPGTPTEIIEKLNLAVNAALMTAPVRERMEMEGADAVGKGPEEFLQRIKVESDMFRPAVQRLNLFK